MIRPPAASRSRSSATTTSTFANAARSTTSAHGTRRERRRVAAGDRLAVALEQLEQPLVAERGHLDRLAEGGPPLALGERPQHRDVDDHGHRLVERADQVLALGQVDAGLAADRRVDLGDEGRRDVDDRDPAQVRRREEPGRVAQRAAADRHDRLVAFDAQPRQLARGRPRRRPVAWRPRPAAAARSRPASRRRPARPRSPPRPRPTRRARRRGRPGDADAAGAPRPPRPGRCPRRGRSGRSASPPEGAWWPGRCRPDRAGEPPLEVVEDRADLGDPGVRTWRRRRTARASRARSRSAPIGSRAAISGRTCGERRSRWARTSGRPSSQTEGRPRYRAQRLRGSTTAPPPVAITRRTPDRGPARRARRSPRAPARGRPARRPPRRSPGSRRPVARSMRSSRSMNVAWWRCARRLPTTLLPLPGSPTRTTSIAVSRRRRSRPRRCRSGRGSATAAARRPPATGASGRGRSARGSAPGCPGRRPSCRRRTSRARRPRA